MPHNGAGLNGTNTFAHDYPTMGTALRNSGRDIVYSCSWLVFAFNHSFTEYGNLRLFSVVQNSHKTLLAGDAQGLTALFETSRQIRVRAYLYVSLQSSCSSDRFIIIPDTSNERTYMFHFNPHVLSVVLYGVLFSGQPTKEATRF